MLEHYETVDSSTNREINEFFVNKLKIIRKIGKILICFLFNGGHEYYRSRSDNRLFQECLSCGHQTPGWTIDRKRHLRRIK